MAEYPLYRRGGSQNRRRRRGEEPHIDVLAFTVSAQLIVCAVLLLAANAVKQLDEARYSVFREQYGSMVGELAEGQTTDYFALLSGGIQKIVSAVEEWFGSVAGPLPEETQPEGSVEPGQKENTPDLAYSYIQDHAGVATLTGAGGWLPIQIGEDDSAALTAPRGSVLSPVVLSAFVRPPVSGPVTSAFSYRYHPITGTTDFHTGIDIAAEEGRGILAALPGEVVEVKWSAVYGNYIIMQHATNLKTFYAHCSEIIAQEGMAIRQGERIAKVGQTGTATGPHLHFSVIVDELYTDPYWVLGDNLHLLETQ